MFCWQVLEAELQSHEPVVSALSSRAQQMIRSGHFASTRIESLLSDVFEKFSKIKDLAIIRRQKLFDSLESQMVISVAYYYYYRWPQCKKVSSFFLNFLKSEKEIDIYWGNVRSDHVFLLNAFI